MLAKFIVNVIYDLTVTVRPMLVQPKNNSVDIQAVLFCKRLHTSKRVITSTHRIEARKQPLKLLDR